MTISPSEYELEVRPHDHIMIDIETLSLSKHNAVILSVGLIRFDPTDPKELHTSDPMLLVPDILPQLTMGREVSTATQKWWNDQSMEAANHWRNAPERIPVTLMCERIKNYCSTYENVWANGNQFDLANLEELSRQCGVGELWNYRAPCDMRTFCRMTPQTRTYSSLPLLTPHHPVDDAAMQAWHVWEHWCL